MLCGSIEFCYAQLRSGLAMNVIDYDVMDLVVLNGRASMMDAGCPQMLDPPQGCAERHVSTHYIKL